MLGPVSGKCSVFFHWVVEKDETQGICWSARLVVVTGLESGKKNILPEFSGAGKCLLTCLFQYGKIRGPFIVNAYH